MLAYIFADDVFLQVLRERRASSLTVSMASTETTETLALLVPRTLILAVVLMFRLRLTRILVRINRGAPGDNGADGICIPTPEWTAYLGALQQWQANWNAFITNGGITACQDYNFSVTEVTTFISQMSARFTSLHNAQLLSFTQREDTQNTIWQTRFTELADCVTTQHAHIMSQFADISAQLDAHCL